MGEDTKDTKMEISILVNLMEEKLMERGITLGENQEKFMTVNG